MLPNYVFAPDYYGFPEFPKCVLLESSLFLNTLQHESEKIRNNLPDVTNATYTCVCFCKCSQLEDIVAAFDDGGYRVDIPVWHEEQKAIVDNWQTGEGLKNAIISRIDDCGLEEYEGLWSIGEGAQFEYSSVEAFLAEVDWEYLLGITKNCWALVSVRKS